MPKRRNKKKVAAAADGGEAAEPSFDLGVNPFTRKLKALKYAFWKDFNVENQMSVKQLIVWLEQTQIRQLKPSEREGLKAFHSPQWFAHLKAYLQNVTDDTLPESYYITANSTTQDWVRLLDYILGEAVMRVYKDGKNEFNRRQPIRQDYNLAGDSKFALTDCESQAFHEAVQEIAQILKFPPHDNPVVNAKVIKQIVCTKFCPAAIQRYRDYLRKKWETGEEDPADKVRDSQSLIENFEPTYWLGFQTGDNYVDAAATILRMQYLWDLKDTQERLNDIILYIQQFTADPKTNARLGKVGR